jgi:hypothetical protein
MVYPALLPLMRSPRLPVVDWTDTPADLNVFFRFAERRNLVSARVPSHFNRSLHILTPFLDTWLITRETRPILFYSWVKQCKKPRCIRCSFLQQWRCGQRACQILISACEPSRSHVNFEGCHLEIKAVYLSVSLSKFVGNVNLLFYGITNRRDNVQWNLFLCKSTLHISGGTHAHHQEYNFNCIDSHWYNS